MIVHFTKRKVFFLVLFVFLAVFLFAGCGGEKATKTDEGKEKTVTQEKAEPTGEKKDVGSGKDVTDNYESPFGIEYGEHSGTLTKDEEGDAYGVKWSPGDRVKVSVEPQEDLDLAFEVFKNGDFIDKVNDGLKGEEESFESATDAKSDIKRLTIRIISISGEGNYSFKVEKTSQMDGGEKGDASDDMDNPLPVEKGAYENCYLGYMDEYDWYGLKLQKGQKATIKLKPSDSLDIRLFLEDQYIEMNEGFKGEPEELTFDAKESGIYKFETKKIGDSKGKYSLEIVVK